MVGMFAKELLLSSHTNSSVLCCNSLQLPSTRLNLLPNADEVISGSNITSKRASFCLNHHLKDHVQSNSYKFILYSTFSDAEQKSSSTL